MPAELFTEAAKVYPELPRRISDQIRRVLEATAPPDEFSCHCTLLEALARYLNDLGNSVYVASGVEHDGIELHLRTLSPNSLSFGHFVAGLRTFGQLHATLETYIPELASILAARTLPAPCVRQVKCFKAIKAAREQYEVPVRRLHRYVASQVPENSPLGKVNITTYLSEVVEFRNRGVGHRTDEGWFAQDSGFYALLNEHLRPSIDALITWQPMQALLTSYELVQISAETGGRSVQGGYPVSRPQRLEGRVPLGTSRLRLETTPRPASTYVARRTDDEALLEAVAAQVPFPTTLQSTEALHQRYRRRYLLTYLARGVITPSQREDDLNVLLKELALLVNDAHKAEAKIRTLVDQCSGAEGGDPAALNELLHFTGSDGTEDFENRITTLIAQFPERRKDYILQIIENNVVTSFDQLKLESELSETDLTDVLDDLEEADRKIRRLDASSGDNKQSQAYFKVQDLQKLHRFRALLARFGAIPPPASRYPALFWELFRLCSDLLKDDGFELESDDDVECLNYRHYFVDDTTSAETLHRDDDDDASPMNILLEDGEIHASSVRLLLTKAWTYLLRHSIDTSSVIPFLIGHTRYLVNEQPYHANGTPFKHPIEHEGVYFEGNLTRSQALNELIRLLTKLHLKAFSPNVEAEYASTDDMDVAEILPRRPGGSNTLGIQIEDISTGQPQRISGRTVRHFYGKLMASLMKRGVDLSTVTPFPAGRVRFLLADEPYHDNGRRFQAIAEEGGYFMEAAFPHAQAIGHALNLCESLDIRAWPLDGSEYSNDNALHAQDRLTIEIGDEVATGRSVPEFFESSVRCLFNQGLLVDEDIPYKSGRVRYFIARTPYHGPENRFRRPLEVTIHGRTYFIETNISRNGAQELMQKLLDTKTGSQEFVHPGE